MGLFSTANIVLRNIQQTYGALSSTTTTSGDRHRVPSPPTTFPHFTDLPFELRDLIWREHLQDYGPRIVELRYTAGDAGGDSSGGTVRSSCPIPAMLHVCHESRAVALERWSLSFGIPYPEHHTGKIYVDFSQDVVYLGDHYAPLRQTSPTPGHESLPALADLGRIRIVAVRVEFFYDLVSRWDLSVFRELREMILVRGEAAVVHGGRGGDGDGEGLRRRELALQRKDLNV